jgi:hypothetical protein
LAHPALTLVQPVMGFHVDSVHSILLVRMMSILLMKDDHCFGVSVVLPIHVERPISGCLIRMHILYIETSGLLELSQNTIGVFWQEALFKSKTVHVKIISMIP